MDRLLALSPSRIVCASFDRAQPDKVDLESVRASWRFLELLKRRFEPLLLLGAVGDIDLDGRIGRDDRYLGRLVGCL